MSLELYAYMKGTHGAYVDDGTWVLRVRPLRSGGLGTGGKTYNRSAEVCNHITLIADRSAEGRHDTL